ncbi:MAG: hypothetical protein KDA78_20350, partial [Planctomycetaceae bacterium]|nr:hypothetical protein [Planctomycetaceae bacterium]
MSDSEVNPDEENVVTISLVDQLESPGPFAPPEDFTHGPEFEPEPRRPIPRFLKRGSYSARRRNELLAIFVSAAYCLIMSHMSYIQELSFYVLPLGYLNYIGWGLAAIGAMVYVVRLIDKGDFKYVREGIPVIGRILKVARVPNAEVPNVFTIQILAEYKDPESGNILELVLIPGDATSSIQMGKDGQPELQDQFEFAFAPGDYVTLVGMPGDQFLASLRIYGLLGLDPDREFALKNGRPKRGMPPYQVITIISAIVAAFALLMGVIYVVEFYWPTGGNWLWAAIPGGIAFAIGLVLGGIWALNSKDVHGIIDRLALAAGTGMFVTLFVLEIVFLTNALLDNSPSRFEPIRIVNFWQTTHNGIFRDYSIEYRPLRGGDS